MRFNNRAYTEAQQLTALVAADGLTGGFVKDSDVSAFVRNMLDDADGITFAKTAGLWWPLAKSAVAVPLTGSLVETTLATITIPAGAMGANGFIRVTSVWSYTNSGNNKVIRTKFGGTQIAIGTFTTTASVPQNVLIGNRNAQNSQIAGLTTGLFAATTLAPTATAIDTSASTTLTFTATLANTGETITLESYVAELLYQA